MKTIRAIGLIASLTLLGAIAAAAAETAAQMDSDVRDAVQLFQQSNPRLQRLFNEAYGYAIFPTVDKGAIGIGGAEGKGQVFQSGALVGTAKLTQATVGAQLGGQSYSEVIFFKTQSALDDFMAGKTAISAGLSAVVADDGAAAEAKYQHGVMVCTMQRSGLMFEASVGGQHFTFKPVTPINSQSQAPASTAPPPATIPPASVPSSTAPTQ